MEQEDRDYGMRVLQATSLRSLVEQVNDKGIIKEDIVYIHKSEGTFFLLYYN